MVWSDAELTTVPVHAPALTSVVDAHVFKDSTVMERTRGSGDEGASVAGMDDVVEKVSNDDHSSDPSNDALRRLRLRNERMKGGKSMVATRILNDCYQHIRRVTLQNGSGVSSLVHPRTMVLEAIRAAMPWIETTTVKVGGASYQVPSPMDAGRSEYYAVKWLVDSAKSRLKKDRLHGMAEALALEVLSVSYDMAYHRSMSKKSGSGSKSGVSRKKTTREYLSGSLQRKAAMHKTAKANRVFVHRRWR